MLRTRRWLPALMLVTAASVWAADASKWSVKEAKTDPPQEIAEPIRKLLNENAAQVLDENGKLVVEIWFRKELTAKATAAEIEKGLTYRKVEQSTLVGVGRFSQAFVDFRKQNVKAGVYTLRLGYQPEDGNHQGTAPYGDFLLLSPAAEDRKPDLMEAKALQEMSTKTIPDGNHPSVMLLVPNTKPEAAAKLFNVKAHSLWVLNWKEDVMVGDKKTTLGIGLTVFGVTTAE